MTLRISAAASVFASQDQAFTNATKHADSAVPDAPQHGPLCFLPLCTSPRVLHGTEIAQFVLPSDALSPRQAEMLSSPFHGKENSLSPVP